MKQQVKCYLAIGLLMISIQSCKKFLDAKPSTAYATVSSVADAQALMDDVFANTNLPFYGEWSADNCYFLQSVYDTYGLSESSVGNLYTWGPYSFAGLANGGSWGTAYAGVMNANVALEALDKIPVTDGNRIAAGNAKGCALALRAYIFWKLAITFSKGYNEATASTDLGIPLRTGTEIYSKLSRASVSATYNQIINDLKTALPLLPNQPLALSRASKPAVYAVLSEVYLSMRDYNNAQVYADLSLSLSHNLIDFNNLDQLSLAPLPVDGSNKEVLYLFASNMGAPWIIGPGTSAIDATLYASYQNNDLRKHFFFKNNGIGTYYFSGNYMSKDFVFVGPAVDEMYLNRAECLARAGNTTAAMADLNTLMKNRIDKTSFVPYAANSSAEALKMILEERRKELVFRDLRWMDLKRLNLDGANIILTRSISGKTYTLQPNDNRYAIQLPPEVIQLSGMQQNPY